MSINKKIVCIILLLTSSLIGCKEKDTPSFLTIEEKKVNLLATPCSKEVIVKTNIDNWTFSVQQESKGWLTAKKQGSLLTISVSENTEMEPRKGSIQVSGGSFSETIIVEQLGQAPAILTSSDIYTLPPEGGEINLGITSNIDYDVVIPADAPWIKIKPRAGGPAQRVMITKEFLYLVDFNKLETERQAYILIKQRNGDLEKKVLVVQKSQSGYPGTSSGNDIKDDIKVPVFRGAASSAQSGTGIENSFDGNMSTIYHSSWNNAGANYFPITLEYFFENQESIDYFVYYPRNDGYNGHFKEVEIWVSTQDNPSYVKTMDYDFKGSSSATKVSFAKPVVKPKSVKFIVKSGAGDEQGFAACAEMEFYKKNQDNFDPLTLFTDLTCTELKPGVNMEVIEKVSNNLYRNMAYYMLKGTYPREFRIQDYKAWPHPHAWAKANKTNTMSLLDNPTGISVAKDEDLIVFVGNTHGNTLSLKVQNLNTPGGDGYGNASFYPLSQGVNKLKMRNKGLAYVFYHTPNYQSAPPVKIHFATGKVNGYFDSRKHAAGDWVKYLNAAVDEYFDVLGEHAHITFPTEGFRHYAPNNGAELIAAYDNLVRQEKEFMGLMKYNRPTVNRAYFHAVYSGYMYSTSYRTAYNVGGEDVKRGMLDVDQFKSSPWGPAHEQGHSFQTRPGFLWVGMTEVTNNVHSLYIQTQWGNASRIETENMGRFNNRYEKAYYNSFVKNTPQPGEEDVFCKLVSLWQLQLYLAKARGNTDFYKDFYEKVRTTPDVSPDGKRQLDFVRKVCEVANCNLIPFFKRWGYLTPFDNKVEDYTPAIIKVTQSDIDQLEAEINAKNYPALTDKAEYICDSNWEIFKNKQSVQPGTAQKSGATITMNNWKNVVAYEVYEGNTLVFVSNKSSFKLDNPVTANTKVYAVAYNGNKTEVKF